jgi:hypothetical protein
LQTVTSAAWRRDGTTAAVRWLLPVLAVAPAGVSLLGLGRERPVLAARVLGGPLTELYTATELSLAVQTIVVDGPDRRTVPVAIAVRRAPNEPVLGSGMTDAEGVLELTVPGLCTAGSCSVSIEEKATTVNLASGRLLTPRPWPSLPEAGTGWLRSAPSAAFPVRAALSNGALAVPFLTELWIEVDGPVPIQVEAETVGAILSASTVQDGSESNTRARATLDPNRRWRLPIRAEEHVVSLRVSAHTQSGELSTLFAQLPTIAGALWAERRGPELLLTSPVPRNTAYVAVVDAKTRLWGSSATLVPEADGTARASLALPAFLVQPAAPLWAVVASEPEKRGASSVGWPIIASAPLPQKPEITERRLAE